MQHHAEHTLLLASMIGRGVLSGAGGEPVGGKELSLGRSSRLGEMWGARASMVQRRSDRKTSGQFVLLEVVRRMR